MAETDPIIRGPKIPLAWSTVKAAGYVFEKHDEDEACDQVLLEDEDSAYCAEITNLRQKTEVTLEVMPLTGLATPPEPSDIFSYDGKAISILTIKKSRGKGRAVMWTITGNRCPGIDLVAAP